MILLSEFFSKVWISLQQLYFLCRPNALKSISNEAWIGKPSQALGWIFEWPVANFYSSSQNVTAGYDS